MKTKLLLLLLLANFSIYAQTNLVPNGDFETWTSSSQPDNWYRFFSGYISQSTTAQNGKSSTNMMIASGTFNYINSEYFAVQANKTYRITLYHKTTKGTFSSVDLSLYHKPNTIKEEIIKKSDVTFSTTEWRKIEFEYTSKIAENIEVDIWTTGSLNSEILIDNVSVVDVAEVPVLYTLIPDANFEKKLIALKIDSGTADGKVLTSAVSKLTSLDVSQSNIIDLTGIQDFTALTVLNVSYNKLTGLDVSNNLALTSLNCATNSLTDLNVSKNIKLTNLECYSNKISSLDISKNLFLKTFRCDYNQLTDLDVTLNTELTDLTCYSNKLNALNVSKNTALTKLQCDSNKISTLDVSGNTALQVLSASSNLLTSLNVSKNTALINLNGGYNQITALNVTNNTALKSLEFRSCKIGSLDLSKNLALNYLDCYSNSLINLDISKNTGLIRLNCSSNYLTSLNTSNNTSLQEIFCNSNSISSVDFTKNTALTFINSSNNEFKSIDLSKNLALSYFYSEASKIESLDLSKNTKLNGLGIDSSKLLYDLNLRNGNNVNLNINIKNTPNLTCVLVDNKVYSDKNWVTSKETWTKYSEDCRAYTAIPDSNFEDKLIALKIDIDGKNGQVLTSSIAKIKSLDVSNSLIADLSGIQDFASLETLVCNNNKLLYLDLSKNSSLTSLNCSNNNLVSLDLKNGKNTLLNKNTSSFLNNANLKCIQVDDESYATANWLSLKDATAGYNTLCNAFVLIPDSNFENKLIALGIDTDGKNGKVLTSSISSVATLDVSASNISNLAGIEGFVALKQLDFSSNNLKAADLSKNVSLTSLNAKSNQLLNLDLSKNIALLQLDASSNNLFSINLKNGNNAKMQNMASGNFKGNPSLTCILIDDKAFADSNWASAKETSASYATTCDANSFTIIPDANFENKLIKLGIDKDGFNGGVLTSSISAIKEIDLYEIQNSLVYPIQDLTGIQDFKALEKLSLSNNRLSELDLSANVKLTELNCGSNRLSKINISKNVLLRKLDCSDNSLTQIDFSQNAELYDVSCQRNKLTSLDFSKNPKFGYLYSLDNKLTSLNLTQNPNLYYLNCASNQLTDLNLSNNKYITYLFCENNQLKKLDVSNLASVSQFGCDNNLLTTIDVSKNVSLSLFSCSKNELTNLDLSNNANLSTLRCQENKLTSLNVSKNKKVVAVNCGSNNLISLNIKNGNNANFIGFENDYYLDFKNNPNLTCIQVDDITFANAKMDTKKDAIASYNTNCGISLVLPNDNFTVETKGESCLGENNGEINITAKAAYVYLATISGKTYSFTNNSLKINSLSPGTYLISITIPDENFEQNFNFTIVKASTISGKSTTTSKKVDVEITDGTAPFTVFVDGTEQFQTTDSNFSLDLNKGGLIEVKTAKACEGVYAKKVSISDFGSQILSAYPNPTSGSLEIEVPGVANEVKIELYNFSGQLVSTKTYPIESGKVQLNLEHHPSGIYAAKIYLETPEYIKIIKK